MRDETRLLADRLRWIYEQPVISLIQADELCRKLPEIIRYLDELVSLRKIVVLPVVRIERSEPTTGVE